MKSGAFIAGDWGTSNLRLFLLDAQGIVLRERQGPGAAAVKGAFATELSNLTASWVDEQGTLPVFLCGMVGSNLGWVLTSALPCPVDVGQIASACSTPAADVHIVPGLSCINRFGATDYMRGEETQILGALALASSLRSGRRLLCLPGTHTKWAVVEAGKVLEFVSAPTGEVFKTLHEHSVLVRDTDGRPFERDSFLHGLAAFNEHPEAQLLHRLFETRSRQLTGDFDARQAAGFLSGLLIASDIAGGLAFAALAATEAAVMVVGSPSLTSLYGLALKARGVEALELDGSRAALAGLTAVQRHFELEGAA